MQNWIINNAEYQNLQETYKKPTANMSFLAIMADISFNCFLFCLCLSLQTCNFISQGYADGTVWHQLRKPFPCVAWKVDKITELKWYYKQQIIYQSCSFVLVHATWERSLPARNLWIAFNILIFSRELWSFFLVEIVMNKQGYNSC